MKVAIIHNKDIQGVINIFGMQNKEFYSEKTVRKVAQSLESAGHNVAVLDGNKQIIERLENFMPRVIEGEQMGMIFNMAYGMQGESRYTHIPSLLEMLGLPYVGSSPSGHTLALDKVLTKIIWKNHGLPTPEFWVFNSHREALSKVKFPVIVKPKMESVSFGLQIVNDETALKDAIEYIIKEFDQQALVEQFIRGREFCVGLLGNSEVEAFPVLEIDLEGDPDAIQTVDDKKNQPRNKICPANIPEDLAEKMRKISIEAYQSLNLRDFSRVDMRLDEHDNIYLLEINSMASLGETGSYVYAAQAAGYDYSSLVNKMLDVASVRYFSNTIMTQLPGDRKKGKAQLSGRLSSFIKTRQQQTEKFLKKLVDINSHVRNVNGVNFCSDIINGELARLGFKNEVHPQLEIGNIVYFTNATDQDVDNLILLSLDSNIKLADHENFSLNEQYLEGSGIWESKGGVAIVLGALQSMRFIRHLRKVKIGILITTDSTLDGRYSKNIIRQKAEHAKRVIAVSGSTKDGGIILSRSGSVSYKLETKLVNKQSTENVSTTAMNFSKTIAAITDISKNDPENVISPFNIQFKSNIFKVYAYGTANLSVRYNSIEKLEEIEQKINKIINVQKRSKIYQIQFEGVHKRPAMVQTKEIEDFYNSIQSIAKNIDVRISKEHRWSSADICHIEEYKPKIDGLGPVGEYTRSGNERILRHSLMERSLLLALVLMSD